MCSNQIVCLNNELNDCSVLFLTTQMSALQSTHFEFVAEPEGFSCTPAVLNWTIDLVV